MNLVLPTVGQTTGTLYASNVNDALTAVDAHDHSSGKGTPVNTAGIVENADHEMNNNRLTEVKNIVFQSQTGSLISSADLRSIWWSGSDWCVTDESGQKTVIFHNGKFNVPALSGGIGGDYSGSTALWSYDNTNKKFIGAQATSGPSYNYAGLDVGDLKILPKGNLGQTTGVTLVCPPNMVSSKSFNLPAAFPATSTQVMTLSTGGVISGSNNPSFDAVTGSNGLFSRLTASVLGTSEADAHHGLRQFVFSASKFKYVTGDGNTTGSLLETPGAFGANIEEWVSLGGSNNATFDYVAPLDMVQIGETIGNVIATIKDNNSFKTTLKVWRIPAAGGGAVTKIAHVEGTVNGTLQHLTASVFNVVNDGTAYSMSVHTSASLSFLYGGRVECTRP